MRILAVIPARWASSRFPGKPLAIISGRPMVQWVWERARRARRVDDVIIATDDERIREAAAHFGARVELTSEHLASGTDRVAEVAARHSEYQILLNVQGDEPLIAPEVLDAVAEPLIENSGLPVATAMTRVVDVGELQNPDVVKAIVDHNRNALYFSRAPIPFNRRDASPGIRSQPITGYRHLGVYGYQRDALMKLADLAPSPLEQVEELEQLRFLEAGFVIRCVEVAPSGPGVDRPEDIPKVEALLKQEGR